MTITRLQWYRCQTCGSDFSRPVTRGNPPKYCPKGTGCRSAESPSAPRRNSSDGTRYDFAEGCGGCDNGDCCGSCDCCESAPAESAPAAWVAPTLSGEDTHTQWARVANYARSRLSVYMHGPAGSGKSYAAEQIGRWLNLPTYVESCSAQMNAGELVGFTTVDGGTTRGKIRDAFEHGGVFILDELDRAMSEVLIVLNAIAALHAGQSFTFADGNCKRHADFILLAGGNTTGRGATADYAAAQVIDRSTLDRFAMVTWDYDEALERRISPHAEWTDYVIRMRHAAKAANVDALISPRCSINGGQALVDGTPREWVEADFLWRDLTDDERQSVLAFA